MASRSTSAYYWAADPNNLYPHPELAEHNGYNYSPAFEFIVGWWRWLPFEVFVAIWRAILLALLVWMAGPFTIFVLFTEPVAAEINAGNIQIMLAAAIVIGFRYPASWAFVAADQGHAGHRPALVRDAAAVAGPRRSRSGATAAIAAVSFVAPPGPLARLPRVPLWRAAGGASAGVAPYYLPFSVRLPFRRWRSSSSGRLEGLSLAGGGRFDARFARVLHHQHFHARRCPPVRARSTGQVARWPLPGYGRARACCARHCRA